MGIVAAIHIGHSHLAAASPFLFNRPLDPPGEIIVEHYVFNISKYNIFAVDETRFDFGVTLGGRLQVNPIVRKFIADRIQPDREIAIVSMLGGNSHNAMMMLQPGRPFDFVVPSAPDLPIRPDLELIPSDALREAIRNNCTPFLEGLAALRASYGGRIMHVASPPPIEDDFRVAQVVDSDPYFRQLGARAVTPATIRLKGWLLHNEIFRAACLDAGIDFLLPPLDAVIDGKWLSPDCVGHDPTHGNLIYAGKVFTMIEKALGGGFGGWDWLG